MVFEWAVNSSPHFSLREAVRVVSQVSFLLVFAVPGDTVGIVVHFDPIPRGMDDGLQAGLGKKNLCPHC